MFALRGCCDCAHVAATQLLRRPHTADRGANVVVVVALVVTAAAAARVVSICFFWARAFAGVFVVVSLAVATVRPHSNRTWCREGVGGRGRGRTISYYIIYQWNRSIICKLPEHIKFEQSQTHTHINTLLHTLTMLSETLSHRGGG